MGEGLVDRPLSRNPLSRKNPLAPVYVCVFLFSAGESMLHVLVSPYMALEFGAGAGVVGAVLAAFALASLLARLPTGAVYSASRAKALLVGGGALCAAAFALVPVVHDPVSFGALMALDGFGWSVATTAQMAVLVAGRPPELSTAWAMGWYSGFTGLGNTAAAVGGFLADTVGFVPSFLVLAAIPALATIIMVRALARIRARAGELRRREETGPPLRAAWRGLGRMPAMVWAGVLVMVYINLINGVVNSFQPLLALAAGLSITQIGILSGTRSWASSTVRLGSGFVFARVDGRSLTTPLVLLGAVSVFLIPVFRASFLLQIPLFLAGGLSRGLLRVTGATEAFEGVGKDDRLHGMTAALLQGGLDLGKLVGPLAGGLVAEAFGLAAAFQVVPVALVAIYLPLELAARRSAARRSAARMPEPDRA